MGERLDGRLGWVGDSGLRGIWGIVGEFRGGGIPGFFGEGDFRRFPGVWRDLRDFGGGDLEEGEIGLGGRLGV